MLAGDDQRYLHDGFIVTDNGRYRSSAACESADAVARQYSAQRTYQSPARREGFVCGYFDLNNFKPYNDLYGYLRGDEMIKLAAKLIAGHCDPSQDFVGHVGGDDFVVLFQSDDWAKRCEHIVRRFNRQARDLFDPRELELGGFHSEDRRGFQTFFPLTTIAVGQVAVAPGQFRDPEEVASAAASARKIAKRSRSGVHLAHLAPVIPLREARA